MGTQAELFPMPCCPNCRSPDRVEQYGFSNKPPAVFYQCLGCDLTFDEPATADQQPVRRKSAENPEEGRTP